MKRNIVALVWLGGIAFAALLYVTGPIHFMQAGAAALDAVQWALGAWIDFLAAQAFDLVRAVAIALMAVALVLGLIASSRGRGASDILGTTALFVGLIWLGGYYSRLCWFAALAVAAVGALSMTKRVLGHTESRLFAGPWAADGRRRRRI